MALDPRIASARKLRKSGSSLTEIAKAYGVSRATIMRWTDPEVAQRDREVSRRWKLNNPEARSRHNNNSAGVCLTCGGPTTRRREKCIHCVRSERTAQAERRRSQIASLWRTGMTAKQIAQTLGTTEGTVFVQIARMRSEGRDIPHRQERRDRSGL